MTYKVGLNKDFDILFQHVEKSKKSEIFKEISSLDSAPVDNALKEANWTKIGQMKNFIGCALLALKEKKISIGQFVTTALYWSAKQDHGEVEVRYLFNKKALDGVFSTMQRSSNNSWLTMRSAKQWFRMMYSQPLSEQRFFVVERESDKQLEKQSLLRRGVSNKETISMTLRRLGFNVFHKLDDNRYMIPSFGMMQTFVNVVAAQHGLNNPVKMEPMLGSVPMEQIVENGETRTRVMSIPYPGIDFPTVADGTIVPFKSDFCFHDFYHARTATIIPQEHCLAFLALAPIVKAFKEEQKNELLKEYFQECYERLVDMEHPAYLSMPKGQAFLGALVDSFTDTALGRIAAGKLREKYSKKTETIPAWDKLRSEFHQLGAKYCDLISSEMLKTLISRFDPKPYGVSVEGFVSACMMQLKHLND